MKGYYNEEEEQYQRKLTKERYTDFIKSGLSAGFTDEQMDWLWENCSRLT